MDNVVHRVYVRGTHWCHHTKSVLDYTIQPNELFTKIVDSCLLRELLLNFLTLVLYFRGMLATHHIQSYKHVRCPMETLTQ